MVKYECEGGRGCNKPCTLEDHQEDGINEPNEEGFCRFDGTPKKWKCLSKRNKGEDEETYQERIANEASIQDLTGHGD
jgi:hypothetical protein